MENSDAFVGMFILAIYCVAFLISIGGFVFWIMTLIDCAQNEPQQGNDKLVWLLVIIFAGVIGSIIYLVVRKPERKRLYGR